MSNKKLHFWAVFALVIGSQIGTGILVLPTNLAPFGTLALYGWIVAMIGIISLAMVFANLCYYFPETGGPHVYVAKIFGPTLSFFTGWTYWIISWVSSTTVVIEAIGYLTPIIGMQSSIENLILEIILLTIITLLNFRSIQAAGFIELILVFFKVLPLIIMPLASLIYFNYDNLVIDKSVVGDSHFTNLGKIIVLIVWGFVGLECATTTAGNVNNPSKTIPKAVILGTLSVAFLYFFNVLGIMGLINGSELMNVRAPYIDATQRIFSGQWHLVISIIASLVCIGTLNAWTLVSGQIALGLAESGILPKIFAMKNKNNAPVFAILVSAVGIGLLLILTSSDNMINQVTLVINFSSISFLFIYFVCSIGLLKFLLTHKDKYTHSKFAFSLVACVFILSIIVVTPLNILLLATLFTVSGVPLYMLWYKKNIIR